jgi:hypothetical protein
MSQQRSLLWMAFQNSQGRGGIHSCMDLNWIWPSNNMGSVTVTVNIMMMVIHGHCQWHCSLSAVTVVKSPRMHPGVSPARASATGTRRGSPGGTGQRWGAAQETKRVTGTL